MGKLECIIHTHTQRHEHARTRTDTHTHAHTHTHTHTHTHIYIYIYIYIYEKMHTAQTIPTTSLSLILNLFWMQEVLAFLNTCNYEHFHLQNSV